MPSCGMSHAARAPGACPLDRVPLDSQHRRLLERTGILMERNHVIVISVVVAALALFGLKVWSDRSAESDLLAESDVAAQRLARAGGLSGTRGDNADGSMGGGGAPGSARPGGPGGTRAGGIGPDGRSRFVSASGGSATGGSLGSAVGGRGGAGSGGGAGVAGGDGGSLGPKVEQRQKVVDFLSSQAPTDPNLANIVPENEEDVALKLGNAEDIRPQGGQDQEVEQAEEGEGIKITDEGKIEFPNYASGDAGTISFQIEPEWAGTDQSDNALVQIRSQHEWNNRLELVKNGEFLRFIITDNTGKEADISTRIAEWQMRGSHDVVATWANGELQLWIDGRLAGRNKYPGKLDFPAGTPMYVGGDHPGSNYAGANATLRGFEFSNTSQHLQ